MLTDTTRHYQPLFTQSYISTLPSLAASPLAACQRDVAVHLQVLPSLEEAQATVMNKLLVLEGLTRSLLEGNSSTATFDEEHRRDLLEELPFTDNEGMPQPPGLHSCCG